jgi:photosystem II stability/assembly factor-like uncharacterized protein
VVGDRLITFRTTDGGKTWEKSLTAPPKRPVQLVDFSFVDGNRGWLIVDYSRREGFNGSASYVFTTTDGGRKWVRQVSEALQGESAVSVSFLSERLGFVFMNDPSLAYTADAGTHWHRFALPNYVAGCQTFRGDLLCAAQGSRSRLMVLTIHAK